MGMMSEFKEFAVKGSVVDLAVGVIIGAAFGKIVDSLVSDVIMPLISAVVGKLDFSNLFVNLSPGRYTSLAEAKQAGAATINYGLFINNVIAFVIVAFAVFLLVRMYDRMRTLEENAPPAPSEKDCPFCLMRVPLAATRCGHCTSEIGSASAAPLSV